MGWLFGHKKRIKRLQEEVQESFENVKNDFSKVGKWIRHLDDKHGSHENEILDIKNQLSLIHDDLLEIKNFISFFNPQKTGELFEQPHTLKNTQTRHPLVQTPVQTPVQTGILDNLTVMERAIIWSLLNSDMKLSYEDLSALLGKDKSTIRGQINTIKQKSESLISEIRESNGKKRLYIPEKIKEKLIKSVRVRVKTRKRMNKSED
jgi:hypothetical protein